MEGKDLERLLGCQAKTENLPELHLPTDYPRPAKVSYRVSLVTFTSTPI